MFNKLLIINIIFLIIKIMSCDNVNITENTEMYESLFKSPLKRIFVYGTLKRGEPNYGILINRDNGHAKFKGIGRTINKYPLVIATKYNIPFLLKKPDTGHVGISFNSFINYQYNLSIN